MQSSKFINIHSHKKPELPDELLLRNAYLNLSEKFLESVNYPLQCGLHPWFVKSNYELILEKNFELFNHPKVWAIGEIGLDKLVKDNEKLQIPAFKSQIEIAERLKKPIIIHCVKSFNEVFVSLKNIKTKAIFHDYGAGNQITEHILKNPNCYISLGKVLFRNPKRAIEILKKVPPEKIFFETDTMSISINDVYTMASKLTQKSPAELKEVCYRNFTGLFQ